ncbi:MAG: hypothetical protein PHR47_04260 [Candidatus Pacebacteria bacterium]|nr:hypothetical protein [Candidatus Paceibacterota bacterium]
MHFESIEDIEKAIIGFEIRSDEYSEEEFFIMELPKNLNEGRANIRVEGIKVIITSNSMEYSFQTTKRIAKAIKKYLEGIENEQTIPRIKIEPGFFKKAIITFTNKKVRELSILKAVE